MANAVLAVSFASPSPVPTHACRGFGMFIAVRGYSRHVLVHHSQISEELKFSRDDTDEDKMKVSMRHMTYLSMLLHTHASPHTHPAIKHHICGAHTHISVFGSVISSALNTMPSIGCKCSHAL